MKVERYEPVYNVLSGWITDTYFTPFLTSNEMYTSSNVGW